MPLTCGKDCKSIASAEDLSTLARMTSQPIALLGWASCPCTGIARTRFESVGACYVQTVWPEPDAPLYKYLQCVHGSQHHSFVFIGGKFVGDGFALAEDRMSTAVFDSSLAAADTQHMCQRKGDESLNGGPLKSCTQASDGSTTGWARKGSCNWDPSDSGYHEVCVTMSDEFLKKSAEHDANDLSSVVQAGGHWCICAWAWASAVQRDPEKFEGITLDCNRTNLKLREVYQSFIDAGADLRSPSGAAYKAKQALDAVNLKCPIPTASATPALPAPSGGPAKPLMTEPSSSSTAGSSETASLASGAAAAVRSSRPSPTSSATRVASPLPTSADNASAVGLPWAHAALLLSMVALVCYGMVKLARRREGSCLDEEENLIPKHMLEIPHEVNVERTPMTTEISKTI